jgi:hypothetical protein
MADRSLETLRGPKAPRDVGAPLWARWKARDANGTWHWFECQPKWNKRLGTWTAIKGESLEASLRLNAEDHARRSRRVDSLVGPDGD